MIEQIRQRSAEVEQKRKLANEKNHDLQLEGERIAQEKKLAEEALDEALPVMVAVAAPRSLPDLEVQAAHGSSQRTRPTKLSLVALNQDGWRVS